jgi:hypothetical protein
MNSSVLDKESAPFQARVRALTNRRFLRIDPDD